MRKILYMVLAFGLWAACESFDRPDDVLDEKKFEDVLLDVHMADALLLNRSVNDWGLDSLHLSHYNQIFVKHQVEPESFARSVEYYSQHLKQYKRIYENVLERITERYDEMQHADSAKLSPREQQMQQPLPDQE